MSENDNYNQVPVNDLHLQLLTTDTVWGSVSVPQELKQIVNNEHTAILTDENGEAVIDPITNKPKLVIKSSGYWEMLGFYTRDLRLGNLSEANGEMYYCKYHLDLANDFLREGFTKPFLITLSRVATVIELSQSRRGFFRKIMNTFTQEHKYSELGAGKKNFFGGDKGGEK